MLSDMGSSAEQSRVVKKAGETYLKSVTSLYDPMFEPTSALPSSLKLAWAGGFVDGEGCVSVVWQRFNRSSRRATMRIRLDVAQNDLQVLEHLQSILNEQSHINKVKRRVAHNRQMYSLGFDGAHALAAIAKISPFLCRKKQQAEVLMAAIEPCWFGIRPGRGGYPPYVWDARERLVKKLQKLK